MNYLSDFKTSKYDSLQKASQVSRDLLKSLSFPKEEWKYTKFESFLQTNELLKDETVENELHKKSLASPANFKTNDTLVKLYNLSDAPQNLVESYFNKAISYEHALHALNTAMLEDVYFLVVPLGQNIIEPIELEHNLSANSSYSRYVIVLEEGAKAEIIEKFNGVGKYFTNCITEIFLHNKASLTHYKIQNESSQAAHFSDIFVKQDADSNYNSHAMHTGGAMVRSDIDISFAQQTANCFLNGLYITAEVKQHIDHHTTIRHNFAKCNSIQDYKGIVANNSSAVFNGKVIVAQDAQQTNAAQQNKNLLLGSQAVVNTKPQLEIFADDVICSHGATVGQLDSDALFYLKSRGLSSAYAKQLLIHAFAEKNLTYITNNAVKELCQQLLIKKLR